MRENVASVLHDVAFPTDDAWWHGRPEHSGIIICTLGAQKVKQVDRADLSACGIMVHLPTRMHVFLYSS